ncbi:lipase maturation factor family protein [bacterium]|nr:lipase maturation factor family protein [bacterium]
MSRAERAWTFDPTVTSGPVVGRAFHRVLAAIFCVAWLSLGSQLDVLIGSRGLLPAAPYLRAAADAGAGFWNLPTLFWIDASDAALRAGVWVGGALSLAALLGVAPRLCIGLATALYLSYATAARSFLSFQWDNLLLECGALAVFLPTDRPVRWIHVLFRVLLFKLYWESGLAKWQSPLGDWQDGSAMTFYYETAPLPVWPAWYAHHLPAWWHHVESWAMLVVELLLPPLAFGPRRARLLLLVALTGFQIVNLATANYGFFVYLALALHLFLLTDRDLQRLLARLPGWRPPRPAAPPRWRRLRGAGAALVASLYLALSLATAMLTFAPLPPAAASTLAHATAIAEPWRLVNTYHLFAQITRARIEPAFEVERDGDWQRLSFWHKPGDPTRAPDLVAPHQPRVDFQLWFYGLSFERGTPAYVTTLLERLCQDPAAVQPLFATPLPAQPAAVRIVFERYRFSDARTTGAWWTTTPVAETRRMSCSALRAAPQPGDQAASDTSVGVSVAGTNIGAELPINCSRRRSGATFSISAMFSNEYGHWRSADATQRYASM